MFRSLVSALALSAGVLATAPAWAQTTPDDPQHGDHGAEGDIVITAILGRNQQDVLSGTSVLTSTELARDVRPTIGETLSRQAGVSATSFGPNASRPVLRGFQGERVRILADGIGSFDVSNTSVDHAVVINPLTADRIEVLRGPASLLFGSSAIGGVVNVIDSRIPRNVPDEGLHADGNLTYGSAANERSAGGRVDAALSDKFVIHFDGTYSKTGDQDVGGFLLAPALRATAAASADPAIRDLATLEGTLPNSAARMWEVAGGAALITADGNLGFSVSRIGNLYGVPVRYSLDPAVTAEEVRLDMHQTRVDVRAEISPASGFLEAIRFRGGYADYKHNEINDTGAIGTTFLHDGWEGRLELVQRDRGGWKGAVGGQFVLRKLNIIGDEKFLPKSTGSQFGLFTVQSLDLGRLRAEAGARVERTNASAVADALLGNPDLDRSFTSYSGSIGGAYEIASGWRLGLNASYTQRAPSAEELFSNGPHAGTQAFELGNPDFQKEISKGLELTLRGKGRGYSLSASLYHSWFNNFIYEQPDGTVRDDLPVFNIQQDKARYYGAEFEGSVTLGQMGDFALNLDGVGDFTHATILTPAGKQAAPRIPALRLLGGLEAQSDMFDVRAETEWVDGQSRIAPFETATKGYTMVNASIAYRPWGKDRDVSLLLSANNIFDVNARRHASFLKDYAPLAGRDLRVTLRFGF
ncbi:TonB-dependent receptor [Chakrabartia godavariana]|nr:TonB-dependent receptor [Chakrabartia godavariana]